jgi:hypothetical protein
MSKFDQAPPCLKLTAAAGLAMISRIAVVIFALGMATFANAQQSSGSIRGTVEGAPTGVTVEVISVRRGVTKTDAVDADGEFHFDGLPPGAYEVRVRSGGLVVDSETVDVSLGGTVSIVMGATTAAIEEIVTTGKRFTAVDTRIAETGLVIDAGELQQLPIQRDLTAVALLAPGTALGDYRFGRNGQVSGVVSFAGASVAENTSFINGLNTTNFRTGVGFSEVPFEFYDTLQIKTGGYSAKYGRSLGGVMNARSKSGSNEFQAGVNVYYETQTDTSPETFLAANDQDDANDTTFDVFASGPIIQDRLFYYVLYSDNTTDQKYAGVQSERGYDYEVDQGFWGAKIDAYITDAHHVELTGFSDKRTGVEGVYGFNPATGQYGSYLGDTNYEDGGDNWIATYTGDITDNLQVSLSYGENHADRTTSPDTADQPTIYEAVGTTLVPRGNWTAFLVESGDDTREMKRVDVNWTLDSHDLAFGLDIEDTLSNNATVNSGGVYWALDPNNTYFGCDTVTECPSGGTARRRTYISGGAFETSSNAYYIQDVWTINDNWTVEVGLRNESFENLNAEGGVFVKIDDQWAPRLSAVWDPSGDGRQKIFANYGLYYLPIAANTNIRMAGGETYIQDYFDWDGSQGADLLPQNLGAQWDQDLFGNGTVPDTRSTTDTNIEPMYQSEFILGYQLFLDSGVELGIKGIYRNLETTIEDVAIDAAVIDYYNSGGSWDASMVDGAAVEDVFTGFHQYVLTNPGVDMNIYIPEQDEFIDLTAAQLNYPKAKRQYSAVELNFARPFDGRWALSATYTWAHSWGNHEGYVKSDNGQDDAGITQNFDQPGLVDFSYGDLPNDRRHTIKTYGTYQLENGLRFGTAVAWQSGRPVSCFGLHPTDVFAQAYGASSHFCGGEGVKRGSLGTTPDVLNVNASVQYEMELGRFDTLFSLDVFNLFNSQNPTLYYEYAENAEGLPDPDYGKIQQYQRPRYVRLSARILFD